MDRLVGLVVKASRLESGRSRVPIPLAPGFFRGRVIPVTSKLALQWLPCPGAWRHRVSAETGRPGVRIIRLGEVESLICHFYLSVAARKFVCADPSLRYTCMLLGR